MEGNIRLDHNDDLRPYEQSGMEQVVNTNDDDFQIVNDRNTIPGEQPETDEEHTAVKESNFETWVNEADAISAIIVVGL